MKEIPITSDYYPVYLDLAELGQGVVSNFSTQPEFNKGEKPSVSAFIPSVSMEDTLDTNSILDKAFSSQLNPFQALVLLIKNAFEGHVLLSRDIRPTQLFENGTCHYDLANETSRSFLIEFTENLELFEEGIRNGWETIGKLYNTKKDIDLNSLIFFILGNQLLKLPVSLLNNYRIDDFKGLSESKMTKFKDFFHLGVCVQQYILDRRLIEEVNRMYHSRYEKLILVLVSKEEVIKLLNIKLTLANNPDVMNEKDLDKFYFDYMVATKLKLDSKGGKENLTGGFQSVSKSEKSGFEESRIKQLYRTISKNCKEIHTSTKASDTFKLLNELFIEASNLYNDLNSDEIDAYIKYHRLIDILCRTINYRKLQHLPLHFIEFTGLMFMKGKAVNNMDYLHEVENDLNARTTWSRTFHLTNFKARHICDDELASIHEEFLQKQVELLDQNIKELLARISDCLREKKPSQFKYQ